MRSFAKAVTTAIVGLAVTVGWFTVMVGWVYGLVVGDYTEWLRFSSPRAPNTATGQIIYMKMAKGVFFATSAQARLYSSLLYVSIAAGASIILIKIWSSRQLPASSVDKSPLRPTTTLVIQFIAIVFFATIFGLTFFGDHIMQLIFTGSLDLPAENHTRVTAIPAN